MASAWPSGENGLKRREEKLASWLAEEQESSMSSLNLWLNLKA